MHIAVKYSQTRILKIYSVVRKAYLTFNYPGTNCTFNVQIPLAVCLVGNGALGRLE